MMTRVRIVKGFLWFFVGLAVPVAIMRFRHGLGAATNLQDTTPWGFWIGFDVLGGVALAAGGFIIAASVYIFHLKEFKPVLRSAVLTAFLGYVLVGMALIFDLGLPWNIWRPTIHWQHHSALFEVAWCVMLYLTVLFLEFLPVVLEKTPFHRLLGFFRKITLPLVIVGIMLSTLHQSSLGTLFLIMPFRLNPLWYSSLLPLLFFVSAVALGLSMVMTESVTSAWLYHKKPEWHLLEKLGHAAGYVLLLYLTIRIGDLALSGNLKELMVPSWYVVLFGIELLMSAIIPMVIFLSPRLRKNRPALATAAVMTVFGIVFHRINVGGIATITSTGTDYFPSWMEFSISIALVSGAAIVFLFFVENFKVYEESVLPEGKDYTINSMVYDSFAGVRLGDPWAGAVHRYSLVFVLAIALGFFLLPAEAIHGAKPLPVPVENARVIRAVVEHAVEGMPATSVKMLDPAMSRDQMMALSREVLLIDGNRNSDIVLFTHQSHIERLGNNQSCNVCHHMNKPLNLATPCYQCHADMYEPTDIFDHTMHVDKMGQNSACISCHARTDVPHSRENTPPCLDCHQQMLAQGSFVVLPDKAEGRFATGYMSAMHNLCLSCHQVREQENPAWKDKITMCTYCHQAVDKDVMAAWLPRTH